MSARVAQDGPAATAADAVALAGVWRSFVVGGQRRVALADVSFRLPAGSFAAYLGPNGAGKSTTVKLLTGILHPDAGRILVAGFSPQRQRIEVARRMGAVFGQRTQLWWDLPVRDSFDLLAAMYGVPDAEARRRLGHLDDILGIGGFMTTPVRQLSLGQRVRADLAAALLHTPQVLFLDEPTVGLDIVVREAVRRFLRELHRGGTTILLTTHDMGDVEALCSRVLVMGAGRLVYDGSVSLLRATAGLPTVATITFDAAPVGLAPAVDPQRRAWQVLRVTDTLAEVSFDRNRTTLGEVLTEASRFASVRDVHLSEPDLAAVLRRLYEERPGTAEG